jgi:hypothetical protein
MSSEGSFILTVSAEVLDDRTFDRDLLNQLTPLYRRLQHETRPLSVSEVILDLSRVQAIFPYAALGVLVLIEGFAEIFGRRTRLRLPAFANAPECVRWIAGSGFVQAAVPWADVEPMPCGRGHPIRNDPYIIPIRMIEAREHYLDLIEELLDKVPFLLGSALSQTACMRIITAFSELCQNILYYGGNEGGVRGYAMLQAFKGIVKFAVADLGRGIPRMLQPKYESKIVPWDDSLAIALAMESGVTTRPNGGGLGLHHVREMVWKHKGILNIRSGSGKLLVSRGDQYPYLARGIYRGPMYFWGTQIGIVLDRL